MEHEGSFLAPVCLRRATAVFPLGKLQIKRSSSPTGHRKRRGAGNRQRILAPIPNTRTSRPYHAAIPLDSARISGKVEVHGISTT